MFRIEPATSRLHAERSAPDVAGFSGIFRFDVNRRLVSLLVEGGQADLLISSWKEVS